MPRVLVPQQEMTLVSTGSQKAYVYMQKSFALFWEKFDDKNLKNGQKGR